MTGARIFLAEDNAWWRKTIKELLEERGHIVVLEATSLSEGKEKADAAKQIGVDIAILNYSLGTDLSDGIEIAKILGRKAPDVKTIFWTVASDRGWGDAYVPKESPDELLAAVEKFQSELVRR